MATSSGGTLAGLTIANYLTGEKLRVHGICVSDNADYFYEHVEQALDAYRIRSTKTRQICDIIDGYKGTGYAKITPEDQGWVFTNINFLRKISKKNTGKINLRKVGSDLAEVVCSKDNNRRFADQSDPPALFSLASEPRLLLLFMRKSKIHVQGELCQVATYQNIRLKNKTREMLLAEMFFFFNLHYCSINSMNTYFALIFSVSFIRQLSIKFTT